MSKYKSFIKILNITNNRFSYGNRWKLSNNILYKKYSSFKYSYASICINNLLFNEKCRIVSRFKDYLIYDDDTEFCRTNYKKDKLRNTLIKIYNFYDKYNKVFPNYMILPENIYMYKNLRRKQKLIDINIEMMDKKNKVKNNNKENKKENLILFDDQVRANINRQNNSNITISLTHTFISNYTDYVELKKNENALDKNKSFVESSINNSSFNISLYSKRSIFNDNNTNNNKKYNKYLYDNSMKSEISLENVVDALNSKKFNKNEIKRKNKCLDTNSILNNTNDKFNDNNKTIINTHRAQNCAIKTPLKNRLYKCERKSKIKHISLNNNEFLVHKKTTSESHALDSMMKNTTEILSNKRALKFASKFQKEETKYNTIENITSSILDRYKNRNKLSKKIKEKKSTKILEHFAKTVDNQNYFNNNASKSKEKNRNKFNNYFTIKLFSKGKFPNNKDYVKYNKINNINIKRKKTEEQIASQDNNQKEKLYSILEERLRINFNKKIKEKNKFTVEGDSTIESTKLSLNNRKTKLNFYTAYDKSNNANNLIYICDNNNSKNKTNQQIFKTIPNDENVSNNYNYNTLNNFKISNTEFAIINNYTHRNNGNKKYQKQNNAPINNNKMYHKKNKTYSLHMINDNDLIFSFNKKSSIYQKKINYLDIKLKKIQEKILKNKINFKIIKEKQRKLSESIKKQIFRNTPTPSQNKKYHKMVTSSTLNQNNSLEKRFKKEYNISKSKSKSKSRNKMNGITSKNKYKKVKRNNNTIDFLHQRNYSLFNNNIKSPFAKKIIKESIKENAQKNKDKIKILNKRFNLKIKCMKK